MSKPRVEANRAPSDLQDGRRRSPRIHLSLDLAVPVTVLADHGRWRGLVRNISEGGVLIEMSEPPAIGVQLEIAFEGVRNSLDAPEPVTLHGEVRHHLAWQYRRGDTQLQLRGVGIRFIDASTQKLPLAHWAWKTGHTAH